VGEAAMKERHRLQEYARELRNNATDAELLLWRHLRSSRLGGVKFRRQQPIEEYIVDFVSFDKKLVIELDGSQHAAHAGYDTRRYACPKANGFRVLRFWNSEGMENIEGVVDVIRRQCC